MIFFFEFSPFIIPEKYSFSVQVILCYNLFAYDKHDSGDGIFDKHAGGGKQSAIPGEFIKICFGENKEIRKTVDHRIRHLHFALIEQFFYLFNPFPIKIFANQPFFKVRTFYRPVHMLGTDERFVITLLLELFDSLFLSRYFIRDFQSATRFVRKFEVHGHVHDEEVYARIACFG